MKPKLVLAVATVLMTSTLLLVLLAGCSTTPTSPPTAFEQKFFNVTTNYVPVVVPVTNYVPVTVLQTNTVTVTNTQGVIQYQTNVVPVTIQQAQIGQQTNQVISGYGLTPNDTTKAAAQTAGSVLNTFVPGAGGLLSTGLAALAGVVAWLRTSKKATVAAGQAAQNYTLAVNTSQIVETARQFIKGLPNGAIYDNALTTFMRDHQAEAGVTSQVVQMLENDVSNADAQVAAASVKATIDTLLSTSQPPPATTTPAAKA